VRRLFLSLPLVSLIGCSTPPAPATPEAIALPVSAAPSQVAPKVLVPLSYAERVARAIRPNIVFTGPSIANPSALVEVRTEADGKIIGVLLITSSGVPQWDQAVQAALWKTERIPRDVNGKVPSVIHISFRPNG
jgi:colicin import membrane protein